MPFSRSILAVIALLMPLPAAAIPWRDAIAAADARVEELWQLAQSRGQEGRHIGTLYNEWDADEHSCSILGRMLGKAELIGEIEKSTEYDISKTDGHETGIAAQSLSNWAYIARRLLETSEDRRIREWNLDCVGQLGIPDSAYIGERDNAAFYDIEGEVLRIMGDVEPGFADKLKAILLENPQVKTVALGSAGGNVGEALLAGVFIRRLGLETRLWNNCYSACTMVFIGGRKRDIWSPYADLSFHQISVDGVAIPLDHPTYDLLWDYANVMGVDADTFVALTQSAPPTGFTTPRPADLCAPGIATWVQRICP